MFLPLLVCGVGKVYSPPTTRLTVGEGHATKLNTTPTGAEKLQVAYLYQVGVAKPLTLAVNLEEHLINKILK